MNNIQPFEGIFDSALLNEAFTDVKIITSSNDDALNNVQTVHDRVFDTVATSSDDVDINLTNKLNENHPQFKEQIIQPQLEIQPQQFEVQQQLEIQPQQINEAIISNSDLNQSTEIKLLNNKIESLQSDIQLLYSEVIKLSGSKNKNTFSSFKICDLFKNINIKNITNNNVILAILFLLLCSILLNNENREHFYSVRL